MDRMMTYCAQSSDDHDSAEACIDYDISSGGNVQYCNDYDAGFSNDAEREMLKMCDKYRAQIKRQEEEINSYRQHIEVIEEEYSKLSNNLSAAEKNIRQKEKQLFTNQETICSLKNELDSFYNVESSFHETDSTPSDVSLSFSNDSNIKLFNKDNSSHSNSDASTEFGPLEKLQLFDSYKKICLENIDLKRQNEFLQMEVRRLKKDNEDFQDMLSDCKKPQDFVNSTPIKNLNFISYQALNLDNNSFSIDEDYDGESSLQCFDRKFKPQHNVHVSNGHQNLNMFSPISATITMSNVKDVSSIENQEVPSILANEITKINNATNTNLSKVMFAESIKSVLSYEVSSIEDEKFPPFNLPDSSASDKSLRGGLNEFVKKDAPVVANPTLVEPIASPVEGTSTPAAEESVPLAELQETSSHSNQESSSSPFSLSHFLTLVLIVITFTAQFKSLHFKRFSISFLDNSWLRSGKRLLYFALLTFIILIWKSTNEFYLNAELQTRLLPFYSIQEIATDILSQFCL